MTKRPDPDAFWFFVVSSLAVLIAIAGAMLVGALLADAPLRVSE